MTDEKKKMTAQGSSVGADDGQPLHNSTENSISDFDEEIQTVIFKTTRKVWTKSTVGCSD